MPGDILYVRETWCDPTPDQSGYPILYKADMPMHWDAEDVEFGKEVTLKAEDYKWRPSIHMPKEYARIFLRVTDVRVRKRSKWLAPIPPIVSNIIIVPLVLTYAYGVPDGLPFLMLTVGIGEVISCGVLGMILLKCLEKYRNHIFMS